MVLDQAAILTADDDAYYGRHHSDVHQQPPADWVPSLPPEPERAREPTGDHQVPARRRDSRFLVLHEETRAAALGIIQGYRPDRKHQSLAARAGALVRRIISEVPNVREQIDVMHLWTDAGTALALLSRHETTVCTADMAADEFAAKWRAFDTDKATGDFKERLATEVAAAIERGDHLRLPMHPEADVLFVRLMFLALLIVERLSEDGIVFLASREAAKLLGFSHAYVQRAVRTLERLGYIIREPMTKGVATFKAPRFLINPSYQDIDAPNPEFRR